MITKEALYHRPKGAFAYAYDKEKLHIRIQTKKNEVKKIILKYGDPYNWEKGGDGGNLNAEDAYGWVGTNEILMEKEGVTEYFDHWIASAKPEFKRTRYAFILEDDDEKILYGEKKIVTLNEENTQSELQNMGNFFCFPYLHEMDVSSNPSWVKDAIFYQIFPERFCNGNENLNPENCEAWGSKPKYFNFMGGDLEGVISKLDYLVDLGINAIYFCPIFESPSNHKYDTTNFKKVDPHFGTNETFKELVEQAHERGIKIMIDAVFNHIGRDFPQWLDVLKNQEDSLYKDWFHIKEFPVKKHQDYGVPKDQLGYESFAFSPFMPKLNTSNRDVRDFLLDIAAFWVSEFDIDGWRLDVANEVDHSFWREFRQTIKSIKDDCLILGEIWHDPLPWLNGDQWDAVMNYTLTDAINDFFARGVTDAKEFMYAVNKVYTSLPINANEVGFNLLDSHDTKRIITIADGNLDKTKLAYLFQFSQPGSPCIYYGGEIGLDGGSDPDCRKAMPWDEKDHNLEFKSFIKKLIDLRKTNQVLKQPIKWVYANQKQVIYKKEDVNHTIYFIINNSNDNYKFDLSDEIFGEVIDMFTNQKIELESGITLKPYSFKMFKK